ncbi:MAG: polysaccharide biosynthesis protein [Oscillospiraceae bacterium]|nr:polysaccharide biosynthesis protein [Candidatus Ruminococcus equi]
MQKDIKQKSSSQTFLKGAMIMSISMVIVKILGMVYKVMLTRIYGMFGDDLAGIGTGLLSNAYEVYIPLFTLATAGFPIAVSRLISESIAEERYKDVRMIRKVSKPFFIGMGLICFALMVGISFFYVRIIKQPYAIYAMLMLAPSIFFGCLVSIYRGYFEGLRNMFPTALSEVVEVGVKVVVGLSLAYIVMSKGMTELKTYGTVFSLTFDNYEEAQSTLLGLSVASAISGISIGSLFSFITLKIMSKMKRYRFEDEYFENSIDARTKKETFNLLLKTAIPIGLAALVMSISSTIDNIVIQNVLYNTVMNNKEELLAQFDGNLDTYPVSGLHTYLLGSYSYALTIMQLITALTQAFGTSAMPSVTNAYTKGDKEELKSSINTVLKLTMLFTLPAGIGLFAIPYPIVSLLYSGYSAVVAARALRIMGISVIFIAASTPICSMLQGVGRIDLPLKLYSIAMVMKILLNYLFVSVVSINIMGAAIGSLVAYVFVCVVGMYFLIKRAGVRPNFTQTTIKPLFAAIICGAVAYVTNTLFNKFLPFAVSTILCILVAGAFYLISLLLLRTFSENEIKMLPKGKNIVTILAKLHLIG